MAEQNLHEIKSSADFQELMSADLNRVSVINFWAPWAEPCRLINELIQDLSKKHPDVLFLKVEAESQPDVTESFDIESVPSVVILRGHNLLDRIVGGDGTKLTASVEKHGRSINKPLSHTDNAPAKPPQTVPSEQEETEEELNDRLRRLMNKDKVVLFMKGSPDTPRCGFSRKIVTLLKEQDVKFAHFDILTDESVRQGLKVLNNWPTFPQLIVGGELVGGLDIAQEMVNNGELKSLVES